MSLLVVALALLQPGAARAANVVNVTMSLPASLVQDPCAAGAFVNLHGLVHTVISYTADNQGGYHTEFHTNFEGVSGERILTGVQYRATDNKDWIVYVRDGVEETKVVSTALVSADAAANFMMHLVLHTRITAAGVTVTASNVFLACRG